MVTGNDRLQLMGFPIEKMQPGTEGFKKHDESEVYKHAVEKLYILPFYQLTLFFNRCMKGSAAPD